MVGFRRERNTASVPYRSNEMGVGFRDDVNYFNLDPITAGPQITSYLDFSNFVPSYVPPPPPPAPVYVPNDNGGGGGDSNVDSGGGHYGGFDHQSSYEGSYTTDNEHTHGYDGSASEPNDPGSVGGHSNNDNDGGNHGGHDGHSGGNASDGSEADTGGGYGGLGHSDGGTIPPMYANRGNLVNDMLGIADNRKPFDTTLGLLSNAAEDIGGTVNKASENIYKGITDYTAPYKNFANDPSKKTFDKVLAASLTLPNMLNFALEGPAVVGAPLLKGGFDLLNYLGNTYGDQAKADRALKAEINEITGGSIFNNPTAAAENAVGDYSIDDTLDPNIGAIPGNYSPPSSNITTVSNPITGAPTYNDFVASTYDDFMADVAAEIAAIDSEYQDFTSSYSNYNQDDNDGGGYDPGNAGHSPGSNANASDPNTGMGMGIGGGNDGFRSAGGKIYASQGGYVNSTGGK